jgi:site-specific recombinase XerD
VFNKLETQRIFEYSIVDDYLLTWIGAFLIDRKARGVSKGTLRFYQHKIKLFIDYCDSRLVENIHQITPSLIRDYLLYLEETNHNPGGRHAAYRTLRAFLYWNDDETEPEGWKNPIRKLKPPRVPQEPIESVSFEVINKLAKSSKFLSPPQADGVLRNFAPSGTDFAKTWNPRSKLRGIQFRITIYSLIG